MSSKKIYDEDLIYLCFCTLMANKLANSIKHTCSNCNSFCCGGLCDEQASTCNKWTSYQKTVMKLLQRKIY